MKKLLLVFGALCALLLLVFGAAVIGPSSLPAGKQDFVGTWLGQGVVLTIQPDARVFYERQPAPPTTSVHGAIKTTVSNARTIKNLPITRMDADRFVVGRFLMSSTFVVNHPPAQVDGRWKMTIDGQELVRNAKVEDRMPTHVGVNCEGGQDGVNCTVSQLGLAQTLQTCFDVTLQCDGGIRSSAHVCQRSPPGAPKPELTPYSKFPGLEKCQHVGGMQLTNITANQE